jgi:exosortase/archaeosortase family protein
MALRYGRGIGIAVFLVAVIVLIAPLFLTTPFSISDTDPFSYVIVPLLMIPLFVLFSAKGLPEPNVRARDLAAGSALFAAFILIALSARFYLSFLYASFRVDMLLLPLAFAALATLLFGLDRIKNFRGLMLYSVFASPAVLFLVLNSYGAFTSFNTLIVYDFVKLFVPSASYLAPLSISANGYSIGIGQACISLGIFAAMALFLVPIAYLYAGKAARKVLWVSSGVALLFVLNIGRMLTVAYAWLTYGPSSTIALVHASAGVILFYVATAAMVLVAGKYGLSLSKAVAPSKQGKRKEPGGGKIYLWSILLALVFSALYLLATASPSAALPTSPVVLANVVAFNFSNKGIASLVTGMIGRGNFTSIAISDPSGRYVLFDLSNRTISLSSPVVVQVSGQNPAVMKDIASNSTVVGELEMVSGSGVSETLLDAISNKTEFVVYNTNIPLALQGASSTIAAVYVLIPSSVLRNSTCTAGYNEAYYLLLNGLGGGSANATVRRNLLTSLCISERIVGLR